jgi:hypothetical protein
VLKYAEQDQVASYPERCGLRDRCFVRALGGQHVQRRNDLLVGLSWPRRLRLSVHKVKREHKRVEAGTKVVVVFLSRCPL